MKIAICSIEKDPDTAISPRLGRSPWIAIYDTETEKWQFEENSQNLNAAQGAGIQTAQNIINAQAKVVLTTNAGPKAMRVLGQGGVGVYEVPSESTLTESVKLFEQGSLKKLDDANVEGHW
jgi:predicted Fe-Mo cluster-binding NifX family protein